VRLGSLIEKLATFIEILNPTVTPFQPSASSHGSGSVRAGCPCSLAASKMPQAKKEGQNYQASRCG
jgi:hypothetical protein